MATGRSRSSSVIRDDGGHALRQMGEQLCAARRGRGENLHDIAACLRIQPAYLEALEAGNAAGTPGRAYAVGFLRSYADHLELDGKALVTSLKPAFAAMAADRSRVNPGLVAETRRSAPAMMAVSVLLAGALLAGSGFLLADRDGSPAVVAEAPVALWQAVRPAESLPKAVAVAADAASAVAAEASPLAILASVDNEAASVPLAATMGSRVMLVSHSTSWIQLRSTDRSFVRARTLQAGERLALPIREDLALSSGDAGAIEILVDGQSVGRAGTSGAVMRDMAMAPEALKARRATLR